MVRTFELVPSPPHAHAHAQVTSFFPFLITVSMHVGIHLVDPSLIYHSYSSSVQQYGTNIDGTNLGAHSWSQFKQYYAPLRRYTVIQNTTRQPSATECTIQTHHQQSLLCCRAGLANPSILPASKCKSSKFFDTRLFLPSGRSSRLLCLSISQSISEGWQRENESVSIMQRRKDYDYVYIFCFHVCKLLHASSLEFM